MASLLSPRTLTLFISVIFLSFSLISAHGGGGGDDDHHDHHEGERNLRDKGLILVKVYCLIIMFVTTFAGGVSPYFFRWNESFLVLGTQFSGGVFFATSMIHFLSDANETFKSLTEKEYPFAFMLASAGYLLTMLADCAIGYVARGSAREAQVEVVEEEGKIHGVGVVGHVNPILLKTVNFGDTFLLILALCFHSVFEGMAIGVSNTKAEAWRNLWTISLHKIFAAIAMGIALLKLIPKRPLALTAGYSFVFAISSPIGVGIGIAINATTQGRISDWIYAISMSIACGIFIYVAINHLIAKGYKPQDKCRYDTPMFKFVAVVLGVAVIAVVMIWD